MSDMRWCKWFGHGFCQVSYSDSTLTTVASIQNQEKEGFSLENLLFPLSDHDRSRIWVYAEAGQTPCSCSKTKMVETDCLCLQGVGDLSGDFLGGQILFVGAHKIH